MVDTTILAPQLYCLGFRARPLRLMPVPAPPLPPALSPIYVIAIPAARLDSILPTVVPLFAAASLLS
jgi:hypothetical protein